MSDPNPLLNLTEDQKEDLFDWFRDGFDYDAINHRLQEHNLSCASPADIDQFFHIYGRDRWSRRLGRAALEADMLIELVRKSPGNIPEAVLAVLGQETFRYLARGKISGPDLARYTALFLRAREQDRTLEFQNKKFQAANRNATERALDAFAKNLPKNPEALTAFEHLKETLLDQTEHLEESHDQALD